MEMTQLREIANNLLWPLWRGIPDGYKHRYARQIWQQFEDNIRSSAYTSDLAKFVDKLCARLGIQVGSREVESVRAFLDSADPRSTLAALRSETTVLALLVRVRNDERKKEYADKVAANEQEEETASASSLF